MLYEIVGALVGSVDIDNMKIELVEMSETALVVPLYLVWKLMGLYHLKERLGVLESTVMIFCLRTTKREPKSTLRGLIVGSPAPKGSRMSLSVGRAPLGCLSRIRSRRT